MASFLYAHLSRIVSVLLLLGIVPPQAVAIQNGELLVENNIVYGIHQGSNGVQKQKLGELVRMPAGTKFLHWAGEADSNKWAKLGYVPQEDLAYFMSHHEGQARGGAYYASVALDSMSYGPKLTIIDPREQPLIFIENMNADPPVRRIESFFSRPQNFPSNQAWYPWDEVHAWLKSKGVQGIQYRETWLCFIDERALSRVRAPTNLIKEVGHLLNRMNPEEQLAAFLELDRKYPLESNSILNQDPEAQIINQLLKGQALDAQKREVYWNKAVKKVNSWPVDSQIGRLIVNTYEGHIIETIRSSITDQTSRTAKLPEELYYEFELALDKTMEAGLQPREVFPFWVHENLPYTPLKSKSFTPLHIGADPYLNNLVTTFEFIDFSDIMVAYAKGNGEPWKLYDEPGKTPMIDRWRKATDSQVINYENDPLLKINRILSDNPDANYRTHVIRAGGDIWIDGVNDGGFYRVTEREAQALKNNPFLTVELRADPNPPDPNIKTFLGRHEYASAKNYKQYEKLLSKELLNKLKKEEKLAKKLGIEFTKSERFGELTQSILKELVDNIYNSTSHSAAHTYQKLISIHPFSDFNGRSTRAWYRLNSGVGPMFLTDFNIDLLMDFPEFAASVQSGQRELRWLVEGMDAARAANPSFPRYFDDYRVWMVAAGVREDDLTHKQNNKIVKSMSKEEFVGHLKTWYLDPEHQELIRKKQDLERIINLRKDCLIPKIWKTLNGGQ